MPAQRQGSQDEADQIAREIEREEDDLDIKAMTWREKLDLLWLLRERYYGWAWLIGLIAFWMVMMLLVIFLK